eukprot:TRINITY_DN9400_c0_g1_i6.p2 TRINITY_DN9400_c0_g1~~TRINITY_DN9400_c0_g1_i6.p2  ORF type:complete len:183 (-),score=51.37 TRINITY_DN9400_c0_g1_i6:50-598(-)
MCIRDRYQRRVRGTHSMTMLTGLSALVPPLVNPVAAIPLALLTAYVPHMIKGAILATTIGYNNVEPRGNLDRAVHMSEGTKDKPARISKDTVKMLARSKAAHENGLEAFTYFGLAVLAAVVTGVKDKSGMSSAATLFLLVRMIYNFAYIFGSNEAVASFRSLCYTIGMGLSLIHISEPTRPY